MSEMLGNQYFMARNFSAAEKEFEEVLIKYPENRTAKKKLVVCYTQTGRLKESFAFFLELIKNDIGFIVKTDPIKDDCPCHELITQAEAQSKNYDNKHNYYLMMGIIWLFCDIYQSKFYFEKLKEIDPENHDFETVCSVLDKYLLQVA